MAIGGRSRGGGGGGGGGGFRTSSSSRAGRNRGGRTRQSESETDSSLATPPVHVSRFGWRRLWYGPSGMAETEEISDCKQMVYTYEQCGIMNRKEGGKDGLGCKLAREILDEYSCTKYKAFWSIWWETELKHQFCKDRLTTYEWCLMPHKPEEEGGWDSWCRGVKADLRAELKEFCGKKFD